MPATPDLVKRRAAQTRLEIVEAAIPLFVEHGFDETPMSEIAEEAGVSRRTLYRYFATKEDIVFESPRQWLQLFNEVAATRAEGESTRDLFLRALMTVGAHIQSERDRVVREFAVLTSSRSLDARHSRSDAEWIDRYLELLLPDVEGEPDGTLLATVCAVTFVATQNALISVWATGPPGQDLAAMAMTAFAQIDCVWPEASR